MDGLQRVIEQVSKEKGIAPESLQDTVEQAMVAAARKVYGQTRDIEAQYNSETDEVELFEFKTVVEEIEEPETEILLADARLLDPGSMVGDELGLRMDMETFGRIAAQTAKQVIIQRVRDSEREKVHDAYKDRVGELITGITRRFEKGAIIVDLGKTEAVIPGREQVRTEAYRQGDRIQAYILEVARNARGPQIVLSRTHPGLLVKLFEMEVPEIYEGIVTIEAAVREPGQRAKIAVSSRDSDVDPVGACVGMKGSRVQAVVAELRGEKIDIIPYSMDPARFVCSAISPAIVTKVILDEDTRTMELIVPDDQLSLAIGRRGQNVRLAAQLTGWKIDIHSETKIKEMNETARAELGLIEPLTEDHREMLIRYGFRSMEDVADAQPDDLIDTLGITEELAEAVIDCADEILTERMRADLARREENARRVAEGLPTIEQEAKAKADAAQAIIDAEELRVATAAAEVALAEALASGEVPEGTTLNEDLTFKLPGSDEEEADDAEQAADGAEQVADGAEQVADGAEQAADGAEQAADGAEQVAVEAAEPTDAPEQVADEAVQATDAPEQAADEAEKA